MGLARMMSLLFRVLSLFLLVMCGWVVSWASSVLGRPLVDLSMRMIVASSKHDTITNLAYFIGNLSLVMESSIDLAGY